MLGSVAIPVMGALVTTGAVAAGAAGSEVEKWRKGEYGEPVKDWWNGTTAAVSDWLGHVTTKM